MELKDRIESLRRLVEEVSRREREQRSRDKREPDEARSVRGRSMLRDQRVTVTELAYPLDYEHGGLPVGSALSAPPRLVQIVARDFRPYEGFESTAFLDVETTGLAGGTGTIAFLVGAGRFDSSSFRIMQFFLHDPASERELLERLASALEGVHAVVTFNGRSFDIPLLETRYAMNRMRFPLRDPFHVDLLAPSRRVWSQSLPSCALSCLEERILGLQRDNDVPGWLIPRIYAEYLRTGDSTGIDQVVAHNRLDILSLTALLHRLTACFEEPARGRESRDPVEMLGAAQHCESLGLDREALHLYREAIGSGLAGSLLPRALRGVLRLQKRARTWEGCLETARALAAASDGDFSAWVEIAKCYEHRKKDCQAALVAAREALGIVREDPAIPPAARARFEAEILHRIARLERKTRKY